MVARNPAVESDRADIDRHAETLGPMNAALRDLRTRLMTGSRRAVRDLPDIAGEVSNWAHLAGIDPPPIRIAGNGDGTSRLELATTAGRVQRFALPMGTAAEVVPDLLDVCADWLREPSETAARGPIFHNDTDRAAAGYIDAHPGCSHKEVANAIHVEPESFRRNNWPRLKRDHGYTPNPNGQGCRPPTAAR